MTDKEVIYTASLTITGLEDGTVRVSTDYNPLPSTYEEAGEKYPLGFALLNYAADGVVEIVSSMTAGGVLENTDPPTNAVN